MAADNVEKLQTHAKIVLTVFVVSISVVDPVTAAVFNLWGSRI